MAASANPQYQHFVPQFLLRNFSHPYKPDGEGPRKGKGGGKRKYEKGMHPKDPVIRNFDLLAEPPTICEKPVKRILGQMNMYQDSSKPIEHQQHVEQLLSKLEGQASMIFRKITKAFEQKEAGLWLMRAERDLLRKFLFLLKYRGDGFRRRFFHQSLEDYNADDKELVHEYMATHGFKRPLDVWFHNIKTIIETDMDTETDWLRELRKRMYPDDAMWFFSHVSMYYMAICTPTNPDDEFILTDNSYNIFEGPNGFAEDTKTGEVGGLAYTPLHEFAPISPKLMILLRCNVLPDPLEDADKNVKEYRDFQRSLACPLGSKSMLADLPISKARNNYSRVVDGRIILISGEDGEPRKDHKFCFKFFPINSTHVHTINALFLDNAGMCSSVVFESQESFARTLEWYLTAPCSIGKILVDTNVKVSVREATLMKLEKVSRDLGSQKETVFIKMPNAPIVDYEGFRLDHLKWRRKMNRMIDGDTDETDETLDSLPPTMAQGPSAQPFGADSPYTLLGKHSTPPSHPAMSHLTSPAGGSMGTFIEDMDQARKMWILRVKIDSWSKGKVDEAVRQRNRDLLLDAYLRLPPCRVWVFVRFSRFAMLRDRPEDTTWVMPEDAIARGTSSPMCHSLDLVQNLKGSLTRNCHHAAHHRIHRDKLATLIYIAGMNDTDMKLRPWLDLWNPITADSMKAVGMLGIYASLSRILFQTPGTILNLFEFIPIPLRAHLIHQGS